MKRRVLREFGLDQMIKWADAVKKERQRNESTIESGAIVSEKDARAQVMDQSVSHVADLKKLAEAVSNCNLCSLCKERTQTVFGRGNETSCEVLVIGEGPGEEEDRQGLPFVGRAGKLLDNMMLAAGLDAAKETYITNVVKCRPPSNRNPTAEEIDSCNPYLRKQIELLSPKLVLVLGKVAGNTLLKPDATMADLRGRVHDINGTPAIAMYHPAYLLRRPSEKSKAWDDLLLARRTLDSH